MVCILVSPVFTVSSAGRREKCDGSGMGSLWAGFPAAPGDGGIQTPFPGKGTALLAVRPWCACGGGLGPSGVPSLLLLE